MRWAQEAGQALATPRVEMRRPGQRVLFVLEAGDAWPSGWVRGLVYRDLFIEHGYSVKYVSRLWTFPIRVQWSRSRLLGRLMQGGLDWVLSGFAKLGLI